MNRIILVAAAGAVALGAQAGPFDQFKGKVKPGMYETKVEMNMPGLPAGMGQKPMTFRGCVTEKDIEQGQVGKSESMPKDCQVKDFKMSGNTATYTTECTGEMKMTAHNTVKFAGDGYTLDMKMTMNQGGQAMNMHQKMESKFVGPCTK